MNLESAAIHYRITCDRIGQRTPKPKAKCCT